MSGGVGDLKHLKTPLLLKHTLDQGWTTSVLEGPGVFSSVPNQTHLPVISKQFGWTFQMCLINGFSSQYRQEL